jgi:hypothetical protein
MNMPNDFFAKRLAAIEQEEARRLPVIEEEKAPNTPADKGWREETASDGYHEPPGLPLAPQQPRHPNAPGRAYEFDRHCHDEKAYEAGDQPCAADDKYQNEISHVRRRGRRALVMALFGLAVAGAAGAFSYRDMFVGSVPPRLPSTIKASNEPNRIAPAAREPQAKNSDNVSQASVRRRRSRPSHHPARFAARVLAREARRWPPVRSLPAKTSNATSEIFNAHSN